MNAIGLEILGTVRLYTEEGRLKLSIEDTEVVLDLGEVTNQLLFNRRFTRGDLTIFKKGESRILSAMFRPVDSFRLHRYTFDNPPDGTETATTYSVAHAVSNKPFPEIFVHLR